MNRDTYTSFSRNFALPLEHISSHAISGGDRFSEEAKRVVASPILKGSFLLKKLTYFALLSESLLGDVHSNLNYICVVI